MQICLIMDNPETPRHPVIAVALQKLSTRHGVRLLDVRRLTGAEAVAEEEKQQRADVYLLKSHAPQALELAHELEQHGALVVNSWESSLACQDRVLMAERMRAADLPWPYTWSFPTLENLLERDDVLASLPFPVIIKSYYSHRGDLVGKVDGVEQLRALAEQWSQEPVVLQEYAAGDGWDIKMWVIDKQIFAARRRTPLESDAPKEDFPIAADELPKDWAHIALEIGRVFNLRLYGVDLLMTERGPIIVDVNSFPGFRGVPGADTALEELVERIGQERGEILRSAKDDRVGAGLAPAPTLDRYTSLSIMELPAIVTHLFERAGRPLLPREASAWDVRGTPSSVQGTASGAQGQVGLFVRYLRRKPARGLAVIYHADEVNRSGNHATQHAHANDPHRSVSLTLDEKALEGASIRFSSAEALVAPVEVEPSGVLRVEELGISVQAFPADDGLPMLAASCDTSEGGPVFKALQAAARAQLGNSVWRLVTASAEPVRYKPANRCVIRYHLILAHGDDEAPTLRRLTLFGKVYADAEHAADVQELQQQLYDEQSRGVMERSLRSAFQSSARTPMLPRPMGIIKELGLTFNQAVQPPAGEQMRTGTRALRAQIERGRGGEISSVVIPEEELRLTGATLARLHTSSVRPKESAPRTGAKEAKRARERADLIAAHNPAHAEETQRLAGQLAARLEALQPDEYRPAHGGFKASQLLFHSHQVFVVDFDGFCLADPALDVGYFLAYLRPSALWYHRSGMRQWFEAAKEIFITAYQQAMLERGIPQSSIDGILERSRLYEAALLFKIATRRVNRLNSPRSKELSAMLSEIAGCL